MKMDKGAILASMAIIALASVLVGAGTMAYFTDVETANAGPITAGTLNMKIGTTKDGTFYDKPIALGSISGLSPGEQFTLTVWLRNDGDLDAQYVFLGFSELTESDPDFSKKIKLVSVSDYDWQGYWYTTYFEEPPGDYGPNEGSASPTVWLNYWLGRDLDTPTKGYVTLYDLVHIGNPGGSSMKTCLFFYNGDGSLTAPAFLPAGEKSGVQITFELMWDTKNEYQGDSVSFRMDFVASQDKVDLDDYITEAVGSPP